MKHALFIVFLVAVSCGLGKMLPPVRDYVLERFHYHPLSVVLSYLLPLIFIGVPLLLMFARFKEKVIDNNVNAAGKR